MSAIGNNTIRLILSSFVLGLCGFLSGCNPCSGDDYFLPYETHEPIYIARSDIDSTIELMSPQKVTNSGKIYIYKNLLFVAEEDIGFHIYNNSDPRNPVNISFLQFFGSTDIAIRNDVAYVNQATDLVTIRFDLTDNSVKVESRVKNVFPVLAGPNGYAPDANADSILINWKLKEL